MWRLSKIFPAGPKGTNDDALQGPKPSTPRMAAQRILEDVAFCVSLCKTECVNGIELLKTGAENASRMLLHIMRAQSIRFVAWYYATVNN